MVVMGKIQSGFKAALGLVYPETCQLCSAERATVDGGFVGSKCWSQVRFIRAPFCARCGLPFAGDLTTVIHRLPQTAVASMKIRPSKTC